MAGPTLYGIELESDGGTPFLRGIEIEALPVSPWLRGIEIAEFPPFHGNNVLFDRGSKWKVFSAGVKRKTFYNS